MQKDYVYERYLEDWPNDRGHVVNYKELGYESLIAELDNGLTVVYDMFDGASRVIRKRDEDITEELFRREFSYRLRTAIRGKAYNQKQFAEAVGVSEPQLSGYITGKTIPSFWTISKICRVLGCELSYFEYISRE